MQIQNHLAKISWTIADKFLFVIYGFVFLILISLISLSDLALFNFLIAINTWIFVISDSLALQSIIQFGYELKNRNKVNLYALLLHIIIVTFLTLLVYLLRNAIAGAMDEPRFLEVVNYLPYLSILMIPRTFSQKLMLREHYMHKIFYSNLAFFGAMTYRILSHFFSNIPIDFDRAVYIYLEGTAVSSVVSVIITHKQLRFSKNGEIKLNNITSFSFPFTITTAIYTATRYLDTLILKLFFPLEQIGIYTAARSLFRFFEEGINGVNGLVYPASVRAITNGDKELLQSMISKAISFSLVCFVGASLVLVFGLADFIIGNLMKSNFIHSLIYFKIMLLACLFLPFNILYFVITAAGKHIDLMKIVSASFVFAVISFIFIGISKVEIFMPIGYVAFYLAFALFSLIYVNKSGIIKLGFKDFFRSINDSYQFILKFTKK